MLGGAVDLKLQGFGNILRLAQRKIALSPEGGSSVLG